MRIPLRVVEDPGRADLAGLSDEERRVWHELRRRFFRAEYRHPEFDPRHLLELRGGHQRNAWRRRRRRWLRELFRGDDRVQA